MSRYYMYGFIYGFFCLILSVSFSYAANVKLQVKGLTGELERNVRVNLSTIGEDEMNADNRFKARVNKAIRQGLQALGYYSPTISMVLQPQAAPLPPVLLVNVDPGQPVKVAAINVALTGEALQDKDYQALVKRADQHVGNVLNHEQYDQLKSGLTSLAWRKGYFDAEMVKNQLQVAKEKEQAFWRIDFNSGQRYRFGKVVFSGSQIDDNYLQNLLPFRQGDFYVAEELGELNHRLAETGWFNAALVTPDFTQVGDDKVLPLHGVVSPRTRNTLETGVGYSTDVGPKVTGSWRKPWLNAYGHSLGSTLSLSKPDQSLDLNYKIPLLANPLEQYYLLQAGFKREDLNDTQADSSSLNVARYWNLSRSWQRAINLRLSYDDFTQANKTNHTQLLYPGVMLRRTRHTEGMMPSWGDTQSYSVDVSSKIWGSDVDFVVFQAQNVWIRSLAADHRFVFRANLGWIETDNFSQVPPSLRFFAGGDRSIRGYKYKSISPKDSNGQLLGASKLATGSLEYQYNVHDRWWGALFVDSGQAVRSFRDSEVKTGAGIGIRWASPVGPIKFDLARPVADKHHREIQFYIGLGPEL